MVGVLLSNAHDSIEHVIRSTYLETCRFDLPWIPINDSGDSVKAATASNIKHTDAVLSGRRNYISESQEACVELRLL